MARKRPAVGRGPAAIPAQARDYIRSVTLPAEHAAMLDRLERSTRYLWAAQLAAGRATLDVGCGDGSGTAILSAAGASPAVGVDASAEAVESAQTQFGHLGRFEVAEPMALPSWDEGFDLVTCFGALEAAPEPGAVLAGVERALKPGGLLLVSLAASGDRDIPAAELLRSRFRSVALHDQVHYAGSAIGGPPAAGSHVREAGAEGRHSVVAAASNETLPALEPQASFEEITGLHALADAVSRWEDRARGAEAEVAAMRWELRIAGEKLTALVQRLLELENAPSRRLRRRLKGEPGRYSADDAADPDGSIRRS